MKEVDELIRDLQRVPGITVKKGGGGHWKVRREGKVISTIPASPSDWRWRMNALQDLRRLGIELDGYQRVKREAERKEEAEVAFTRTKVVSEEQAAAATETAKRIANEIKEAFQLKVSKGRVTGHGTVPHLTRILISYHEVSGQPVPHLNYAKRDANDVREMARLAANSVTDLAAGNYDRVTPATYAKVEYAAEAWDFHLGKLTIDVADEMAKEAIEVLESTIHTGPVGETVTTYIGQPEVATAANNGKPDDAHEFAMYRLIARLVARGESEDDAVMFAIEIRDALAK